LSIPVLHGYIIYPDILAGYKNFLIFILSYFLKINILLSNAYSRVCKLEKICSFY